MRIPSILVILLLFCVVSMGQTSSFSPQIADRSSPEQTVASLLADDGQAPIFGFLQTVVSQLGDDAAVGVIQYLGERKMTASADPASPQEIRRILEIVRMAFAVRVISHPDRTRVPNATLVLLKYLACLPAANAEKENLESTSRFVEDLKLRQLKAHAATE